jgi:hypothetical protein
MDMALSIIAAFLGGCLLTAISFVLGFSGKVATLTTLASNMAIEISTLKKQMTEHVSQPPSVCPGHVEIAKQLAVLAALENQREANRENAQQH